MKRRSKNAKCEIDLAETIAWKIGYYNEISRNFDTRLKEVLEEKAKNQALLKLKKDAVKKVDDPIA